MVSVHAPQARVAVVFLTPDCGLHCPYCGALEEFRALDRAQALGLVDELAAQGFESVVFGGGEPLRWPHGLRELCAAARARGLVTQVGSSCFQLPPDAADWREVDRWVVPLESAHAPAHDALRPLDEGSHHAQVLRALHAFALSGRSVTVSSVARLGGEADLESVARLLLGLRGAGLRLHAWHLYRFQPMGRQGRANAARFALSDEAWLRLSQSLKQGFPRLPVLLRPDMMHSHQVAFFWGSSQGLWRQGPDGYAGPQDLGDAVSQRRPQTV